MHGSGYEGGMEKDLAWALGWFWAGFQLETREFSFFFDLAEMEGCQCQGTNHEHVFWMRDDGGEMYEDALNVSEPGW